MYVQISIMIKTDIIMPLIKLLLNSSSLIFGGHSKDIHSSQIHHHLSHHTQPVHYDINIILHTEDNTFYGESNITIFVLHNTHTLSFYSKHLDIDYLTTLSHKTSKKIYVPSKFSCNVLKICTFYFDYEIPQGYYFLKLNYFGEIFDRQNSDGIFMITYIIDQQNQK